MHRMLELFLLLDLILSAAFEKEILLNTTRDGWKDWKKNTEKYQGWRVQNLPPNGDEVYGVCDVNQRSSNNWLRSPFIPRDKGIIIHVRLSFTMRECKSYPDPRQFVNCQEDFHLLKYEADVDNEEVQYNEKYFVTVETISSNLKWEDKDRTENILNVHESTISVRRTGLIIAFKNTGSCVMIKEVTVFYVSCPSLVNNFVGFPTTATGPGTFERNIEGQCVDGAVRIVSSEQMLNYCLSTGKWRKETFSRMCDCNHGYEGNKNRTICSKCHSNYFKSSTGDSSCLPCPENTFSPIGSSKCYCSTGYYEIPSKLITLLCRKPPPKPRNLHLDASDQARIILMWDSPKDKEISDGVIDTSLRYSVTCVNCPNKLTFSPSHNTTGNKVVIYGALPSREYNFKVTTENYVTQFVTNAFDLDQSASKALVLTTPLENIEKIVIDKAEMADNSISVTWVKPSKSTSNDAEYECVLFGYKDRLTPINARNPDYAIYSFTFLTSLVFERLETDIFQFTVKVRWRNSKGWGQFSEAKIINVVKESASNIEVTMKPESLSKTSTMLVGNSVNGHSKKEVVLVIVGAILFVVLLVVVVILVIYCVRRQMIFSAYKLKIKKNKYDSSNPRHLFYASAYSLPVQAYVKYHDPSTYEDISIALQDFTKEVDPNWISAVDLIGEGEYTDVFRGSMKIPRGEDRIVAIKILKASTTNKDKSNFLIEASTMGQFNHDSVLKLHGVVSLSEPFMIVTDYMVNGTLLDFLIANKDNLTIIEQLKMLSNIASGMRYLASIGFVHRDLAARNILLDEDLICKIADFGLSRELNLIDADDIYQSKNEIKIPIKWTAPEAILYQKFSHTSDVWSFGVMSWEVLSYGDKPYWQWSNQDVIDAIQSGYRLPPPVNCPPIIHNLMLHCWDSKPEQRPTFTQLYYELDHLLSRLAPQSECRQRDYKTGEKAHLLRHCSELQSDGNRDFQAPQPPPRNVIFETPRNTNMSSVPDALALSSTSCGTNTRVISDFQIKEPIMTLARSNSTVIPLQTLFPDNLFYRPSLLQPANNYQSYLPEPMQSNHSDIPVHKVGNSLPTSSPMTVDEFLVNIRSPQYAALLRQSGIHTPDQLRHIKDYNLKSLGIESKEHRKTIIRALKAQNYC